MQNVKITLSALLRILATDTSQTNRIRIKMATYDPSVFILTADKSSGEMLYDSKENVAFCIGQRWKSMIEQSIEEILDAKETKAISTEKALQI